MAKTIPAPEQCTIINIEELFIQCKASLESGNGKVAINGSKVEKVDFTFIQMLLLLKSESSEFKLIRPSESLKEALSLYQIDLKS